jgi:Ser/Thr protein kinase RdoA (MazF antagonist)
MASVYLDADLTGLVRLARLLDADERGEASATMLGEIRQLEDRFGLSPLARRRLEWEVQQAEGAKPAPAKSRRRDPRLRSIDGGAA